MVPLFPNFHRAFGRNGHRAFSLTELMIVCGIMMILSSMVSIKYTEFTLKARQGEVFSSLRIMHALQETYQLNRGAFFPEATSLPGLLSGNDDATCEVQDQLGFSIPNCVKANYYYTAIAINGGYQGFADEKVRDYASGNPRRAVGPCANLGADLWFDSYTTSGNVELPRFEYTDAWIVNSAGDILPFRVFKGHARPKWSAYEQMYSNRCN